MKARPAKEPQMLVEPAAHASPWANPYVWLVVGGPAAVVLASMVTLWLALRTPEVSVLELHNPLPAAAGGRRAELLPAMQGRNHAATGGAPRAPSDAVAP